MRPPLDAIPVEDVEWARGGTRPQGHGPTSPCRAWLGHGLCMPASWSHCILSRSRFRAHTLTSAALWSSTPWPIHVLDLCPWSRPSWPWPLAPVLVFKKGSLRRAASGGGIPVAARSVHTVSGRETRGRAEGRARARSAKGLRGRRRGGQAHAAGPGRDAETHGGSATHPIPVRIPNRRPRAHPRTHPHAPLHAHGTSTSPSWHTKAHMSSLTHVQPSLATRFAARHEGGGWRERNRGDGG